MSCLGRKQGKKYVVVKNRDLTLKKMIQSLQPEYTLDFLNDEDTYSTDVIRSKLTRDVAATFKEVREEFVMAMDDLIPTRENSTW